MKDYFFISLRNVRKRGIRSWLTMLGIFIGIAAVVSLITLGQGLETAITGQFSTLSTDILTITGADTGFSPPGSTAVRKLTSRDLDLVESVSGVQEAIPRLLRVAKLEFGTLTQFGYVASMPEDSDQVSLIYSSLNVKVDEGRLLRAEDRGKIVLGNDYKTNKGFEKEIKIGSKITIQGREFEVVGFMKRASTFTLNSVVLMPEADMRDVFEVPDEIDLIIAKVSDEGQIESVAEEISKKFRRDRDQKEGEEDFQVQTPIQSLEAVSTIIGVIKWVVTGIAAISLLVGGIGIINTMFTSVLERTKEIGVMKAIGAKNSDILSIFLIEAALLGFIGGLIGALIGMSLALLVSGAANSYLGETIFTISMSMDVKLLDLTMPFWVFFLSSVFFSLFIGVISGIIPALQASKLNPVDALRK